ncbi:hypothetical protein NQ317_002915 [Molorchus minor]|uniref:Transposable element P transposase-like RNase H C-terminal domain-containing protein n=1 Tax=Molorchus minor TaxID=1323400 RepID=A0ABQ9JKM7_9CUCU|nr:hypothetical protein NQ317_002915 [Molorchus minor]
MYGYRSEDCGNCQRPRGYKSGCSQLFDEAFCSPIYAAHWAKILFCTEYKKLFIYMIHVICSCNRHTLFPKSGKDLKCISSTSKHTKFWIEARHNLSNMYFQLEGKNDKIMPPSLRNWIIIINGLKDLYESLFKEGFSFIKPRVFNQNPVENFFGQLRQQGSRNINPTASMFRIHFKTFS